MPPLTSDQAAASDATDACKTPYTELLTLAWWQYWSGNYAAMSRYLSESLSQRPPSPSARISEWIEHFSHRATTRQHPFAIDHFTDLAEWKTLVDSTLMPVRRALPPPNQHSSFVLYRTLGNDLPPRHEIGQTFNNLKFILQHEPPLHHCQKKWIVNKIVDPVQEKKILALLDQYHQDYSYLPFDEAAYAKVAFDFESFATAGLSPNFLKSSAFAPLDTNSKGWALDCPYKPKNLHTISVNAIRNWALEQGKQLATWTLAFDGGCFMTHDAWDDILQVAQQHHAQKPSDQPVKHLLIPMARLTDNAQLFDPASLPPPEEEPQIIVHRDSQERFDEDLHYGRFTKVEIFRRLQYPGVWDNWNYKPWEKKQWCTSPEAGQWQEVGWVARLASGHPSDQDQTPRGLSVRTGLRQAAVWDLIDRLDERIFRQRFHPHGLLFFNPMTLEKVRQQWQAREAQTSLFIGPLMGAANSALQQAAYSVIDKKTLPPSGQINDYWSLSAFNWPDPEKPDGLPYIFRDGQRLPENVLYSPESRRYDYTALQLTFDNTTLLALAWYITGQSKYAVQAAKLVRTWFLNPITRMNPHLKYAQIVMGQNQNLGARWGLIDTKDFYYFLDAIRLLRHSEAWSDEDHQGMQAWCRDFLDWLINSPQGLAEDRAENNHATCYDLQKAALAGFVDDAVTLFKTLEYSKMRITQHIEPDGKQPHELVRSATFHYCAFNLQNWANLACVCDRVGLNIAHYTAPNGANLEKAFRWILPYYRQPWPHRQIQAFDRNRLLPLHHIAFHRYPSLKAQFFSPDLPAIKDVAPVLHPYSGIPPYWMFAL